MQKKKSKFYAFLSGVVKLFYRKRESIGLENIPQTPCLIIGNHAQAHGPFYAELYFPMEKKIWCVGEMMKRKEVPAYAYKDFWSYKPKWSKWFYKALSHLIAPLCAYVFTHADTIGVYKDTRVIATIKGTARALREGKKVIIFPENEKPFNEIVNAFQTNFIEVARSYYKLHKEAVSFVPMYNAAELKKVVFGTPIAFDPEAELDTQKREICAHLQAEITRMAKELPRHRVVPYANVKKKAYPYSKEEE